MEVTRSQLIGNIVKLVIVYLLLSIFLQGWLEIFLAVVIVVIGVIGSVVAIGKRMRQRYFGGEDDFANDDYDNE